MPCVHQQVLVNWHVSQWLCIFTLQKPSLIQAFTILRKRCNPDISDSHSSFFILSSLDHTYAALFTELCETKVNCIKPMTLSQTSSAFWVCINLQQSHVIQCAMAVGILFTLAVQHNVRVDRLAGLLDACMPNPQSCPEVTWQSCVRSLVRTCTGCCYQS